MAGAGTSVNSVWTEISSETLATARERTVVLSTLHYVFGGIGLGLSMFSMMQFFLFAFFAFFGPGDLRHSSTGGTPQVVYQIFVAFWGLLLLLAITASIMSLVSGYFLRVRRNRTFIMVTAVLNLPLIPYGTFLGIYTLVSVGMVPVRALFAMNAQAALPTEASNPN